MSRHRAPVRPRYGRLAVLGSSVAVTMIAVLAGTGILPSVAGGPASSASAGQVLDLEGARPSPTPTPIPTAGEEPSDSQEVVERTETDLETDQEVDPETLLPQDSGTGRRIVFSESLQRVWLVEPGQGGVQRTYLVSGSTLDNLDPGTYEVYSTSRWAVGIDDSGVMEYFVRFTQGPSGAAIGFHTIPTKDGDPLQTKAQLGTPQSHGCIRQRTADAIALWDFAPIGTKVVVTA